MMVPNALARLLLIEDDDAHADLFLMALEAAELAAIVDRAIDGEDALRRLRKEGPYEDSVSPDIVVLDLTMPRLDGHEVLERIRADQSLYTLPVVVLSTSGAEIDRDRVADLGASKFLTKPLDVDAFRQVLRDLQLLPE